MGRFELLVHRICSSLGNGAEVSTATDEGRTRIIISRSNRRIMWGVSVNGIEDAAFNMLDIWLVNPVMRGVDRSLYEHLVSSSVPELELKLALCGV